MHTLPPIRIRTLCALLFLLTWSVSPGFEKFLQRVLSMWPLTLKEILTGWLPSLFSCASLSRWTVQIFWKTLRVVTSCYIPCNFAYFCTSSKCSLLPSPSLDVPVTQLLLVWFILEDTRAFQWLSCNNRMPSQWGSFVNTGSCGPQSFM